MFGLFGYGSISRRLVRVAFALAGMLMLLSTAGAALWANSGGETGNDRALVLEAIKVTANKIEEDVKDVPQSITVIDESILEEKGIMDVPDLVEEIPNMNYSPNHGSNVNFRGLNSSLFTSNNPVVIYIDGVPYSNAFGFDASLVNVNRIEVLRGPQGTLYGKDAIGGVINIVTKEPGDAWQGKVGLEYGSFDYMLGTANISGPVLKDKLYLGVNAQYNQDNGWIENDVPGMEDHANREEKHNISAYLQYRPGGRFGLRLTASDDYARKYWINGYGLDSQTKLDEFNRDDAEHVRFDVDHVQRIESKAQSLHLTYGFDAVTMTSTTTHRNLNLENDYDGDYANNASWAGLAGFLYSDAETWTQELRVASSKKEGVRWVTGIYFDSEEFEKGPYGTHYPGMGVNYEMNAVSESENDTQAVFGQIMAPFGGGFELTLGGRYQWFNTEMDMDMYYLPVGMEGPAYFEYQGDESWTTFLPKAALSYKINDAWNAYASWAKGYMPGGFNFFATSGTSEDNCFEPQQSTNYELGLKGEYDRFRLAASVFYMDIEDIHVYKSMGAGIYLTDNADSAHSRGVELEMTCFPTNTTELTMGLGVIDAEYDDYDAGDGTRFDGESIQETPAYTARIGFAYFHPLGFYTRADVRSQGDTYYFDDANKIFSKEGGFIVAGMKIGYRFKDFDMYAYGKNLTDEAYVESFKSSSLVSLATFGDPRTFGVGLRYQF